MPTLASMEIPPPRNWEDFEDLCCDLWQRIWHDSTAQRHGRQGQPQAGVDVYGRPHQDGIWAGQWAGVQCKGKSRYVGSKLTKKQIETEVKHAKDFNPRLSSFTIATTARRDGKTQMAAREITEAQKTKGSFDVQIAFWEDIALYLAEYPEVVKKHYPQLGLEDRSSRRALREDYLRGEWARLIPVPLLGLVRAGRRQEEIPLSAVYTALDVTAAIRVEGVADVRLAEGSPIGGLRGNEEYLRRLRARVRKEASEKLDEEPWRGREQGYGRRFTAVEAIAAAHCLVLLGPGGSGKSTFARYLSLCLAGEALGRPEANLARLNGRSDGEAVDPASLPWPHGALLPVFVELRKLVSSNSFPVEGEAGDAHHLLTYLDAQGDAGLAELFRQAFAEPGGALLVLDGLDETPAAELCRERLKQIILSFTRRYPETRVLVTSRPYAYQEGSPWRLDEAGFEEATLAPFDDHKTRAYVEGWYRHLAARGQLDADAAEARIEDLVREIRSTPYLQPLAERPLMLTMMADLHASAGGRLRGGRAGLYEHSVELLLDRWNQLRDVGGDRTIAKLLGMDLEQIRQALEALAYEVHRQRGRASRSEPADITDAELWKALDRERSRDERSRDRMVDERRVMDYLHQRSGILLAESPSLFRFPHRSYQEYLAACHLTRVHFPELLLSDVKADPALWREVTLLAAGKVAGTPFAAWALLEGLVPREPDAEVTREASEFLQALYAALAVAENELWRKVQNQDAGKLERIRLWLERSLELGALPPPDRAAGGRVLAHLGDRRKGVGLREDGLPDIDWVEVPAGPFVMGPDPGPFSKAGMVDVEVGAFRIARFPVTNVQYETFVSDGGYTSKWRRCWTKAGWQWKGERRRPEDQEAAEELLLPNHPRVIVTWYEAYAFSRWLAERLGYDVRLPGEAEWEKAARDSDGRAFPWGEEFDAAHCNVGDTGIGTTSAVGAFPSGSSPYGVLDMSGNVWEWCATKWRESYEEPPAEDPEGTASRVARGGSFVAGRDLARCAFRGDNTPLDAYARLGFRVSAPIL